MEKIRTTVKIAGKEYTMSGFDSEEYIQRVAVFVDRKMQELGLATRLPTNTLAVLTAMNLADDLLKAHDENTRLRRELAAVRQESARVIKENTALKADLSEKDAHKT